MSSDHHLTFEQCALASELLTKEQVEEARATVRWSDQQHADSPDGEDVKDTSNDEVSDKMLAGRLVEMGLLGSWQAEQLLEGRTKFTLGPYRIIDAIGQGGMGQVFKAEHSVMGRVVAVKVLPKSKSTPEAVQNFTREIRNLASMDHRRLVRALDAGHDGNVYFLVCEYVPGLDLRKLVRRDGPLDEFSAARIIYDVAEGLQHAHDQGLIHRDVKPGNVLVTPEGEAKLSDLGLAGPVAGDIQTDPRFGKIVGTADYLSPDHIKSPCDPTPAWDIYSLGCTLYYAVTGKVPFPGGRTSDKARAHLELRPLDPRRLNEQLSHEFVDLIADMMAKDPAERVPSARAVMTRLEPWIRRKSSGWESPVDQPMSAPAAPVSSRPTSVPPPPPVTPPPVRGHGRSVPSPPPITDARGRSANAAFTQVRDPAYPTAPRTHAPSIQSDNAERFPPSMSAAPPATSIPPAEGEGDDIEDTKSDFVDVFSTAAVKKEQDGTPPSVAAPPPKRHNDSDWSGEELQVPLELNWTGILLWGIGGLSLISITLAVAIILAWRLIGG